MPPSPNSDLPSVWPSPRISFSFDAVPDPQADPTAPIPDRDFEFRLAGPSSMLPADQLFSDGKLVPLHFRPEAHHPQPSPEPFDPSPRAPTCSIRWRDLLALKAKLHRKASTTPEIKKTSISSPNPKSQSLNQRTESASIQPALSLPLLRSSSLGDDCEESLRMKFRKRRAARRPRGVLVESPRMNSSGRVVFHGLERSSSGGNGGARIQVRVRPVINVPVGSLVGGSGSGHSKSVSALGFGIHGSRRKAMQLEALKL